MKEGYEPLEGGWYKINTDGTCFNRGLQSACGGVIWNTTGEWTFSFVVQIGASGVLDAELKGIQIGLMLAKDLKLRNICIKVNSAEALSLVKFGCLLVHPYYQMVKQIEDLAKESE